MSKNEAITSRDGNICRDFRITSLQLEVTTPDTLEMVTARTLGMVVMFDDTTYTYEWDVGRVIKNCLLTCGCVDLSRVDTVAVVHCKSTTNGDLTVSGDVKASGLPEGVTVKFINYTLGWEEDVES